MLALTRKQIQDIHVQVRSMLVVEYNSGLMRSQECYGLKNCVGVEFSQVSCGKQTFGCGI